MAVAFDPAVAEITTSGQTAAMLLQAQQQLCALCVEEVLKKIDAAVENDRMTPDKALAMTHEIAAFRRIVYRQRQAIEVGRNVGRQQELSYE